MEVSTHVLGFVGLETAHTEVEANCSQLVGTQIAFLHHGSYPGANHKVPFEEHCGGIVQGHTEMAIDCLGLQGKVLFDKIRILGIVDGL